METAQVHRIDELELFAGCTKAELRKINSLITYVQVPKGQVFMREGTPSSEFVIIGSGNALVTRETDQGVTKVAEAGTGEFLGETGLLAGTPRAATVTASTDLEVFVSGASEFRSMMRIAPSVAHKVHRISELRANRQDVAA